MKGVFLVYFLLILNFNTRAQHAGMIAVSQQEDALSLPFPSSDFVQLKGVSYSEVINVYNKKINTKIDGSPYLYDSWFNHSKIYFRDKVYNISSLNYNIYAERFEAKLSEDSVLIINSGNVKKVMINERIFNQYLDTEVQKQSYFEEIIDFDNYRILIKHFIKIKEGSINPLTKQNFNNDALIKKEIFYTFNLIDNSLKKIKLNKSTIESYIETDFLERVNHFVKGHSLNYKDINDVKRILEYYNSLKG